MTLRSFQGVIFDMDGVLIDSEPVIRAAAQLAAEDLDHVVSDTFYLSVIGLPRLQVERAFMREFGADFPLMTFREHFEKRYREQLSTRGIAPKPGVPALLDALITLGIPIAVATATRAVNAQEALDLAGLLPKLPIRVTGDQVQQGKPDPEIFLAAATRLGLPARHCIAVEDSDVGARAAVAAGMYTLMVPDLKAPSTALIRLVSEVLDSMPSAAARILGLLAAS